MKSGFDYETTILEWVGDLEKGECLIISDHMCSANYEATAMVSDSLLGEKQKQKWKDNSQSTMPPDFINEADGLMLEVMRFDDHSPDGTKNPYLARVKKMAKDAAPFVDELADLRHFYAIPNTGLPTDEDHNYKFYYNGFRRTVEKHLAKVETYRKNHPNKKLVFLAMDESSGVYIERVSSDENGTLGRPHFVFFDRRFVEVFQNSGIDYFILFTPFNHFETLEKRLELPKLVIYDIGHMKEGSLLRIYDYDETRMVSSER